jgi:hypothetical protein
MISPDFKGERVTVVDLSKEHEDLYLVCLEEWNDDLKEAKHIKTAWYQRMKELGLRVKLALTDHGIPGGMIEYMPIEYSYADGSDLYMVNCIWVHGYAKKGRGNLQGNGMGTALLTAAEDDVRAMGKKGLAAWGLSEEFWMSASWFLKLGYEKADQEGWAVLVWKPFIGDAAPPKWIKGAFKQERIAGRVTITSFCGGQCCSENAVHHRSTKVAAEFTDEVVHETIDMSVAENRRRYGLNGGLYINGENLFAGPPPSEEQIRSKVKLELGLNR